MPQKYKIIKFVYEGDVQYATCPADCTYKDVIKIAIRIFSIPVKFKDFIGISSGGKYFVTKKTFKKELEASQSPYLDFHICMDYVAIVKLGAILVGSTEKRLRYEYSDDVGYRVEALDEPRPKRARY